MNGAPDSSRPTSSTRTTCSLVICAAQRASSSRRATTTASSAKSGRTSLIATRTSSSRFVAAYTTPMPPRPSKRSRRYFPARQMPGSKRSRLGRSSIVVLRAVCRRQVLVRLAHAYPADAEVHRRKRGDVARVAELGGHAPVARRSEVNGVELATHFRARSHAFTQRAIDAREVREGVFGRATFAKQVERDEL